MPRLWVRRINCPTSYNQFSIKPRYLILASVSATYDAAQQMLLIGVSNVEMTLLLLQGVCLSVDACVIVHVCVYKQGQRLCLYSVSLACGHHVPHEPWAPDGSFRFPEGKWSHFLSVKLGEGRPCVTWLSNRQLFRFTCMTNSPGGRGSKGSGIHLT